MHCTEDGVTRKAIQPHDKAAEIAKIRRYPHALVPLHVRILTHDETIRYKYWRVMCPQGQALGRAIAVTLRLLHEHTKQCDPDKWDIRIITASHATRGNKAAAEWPVPDGSETLDSKQYNAALGFLHLEHKWPVVYLIYNPALAAPVTDTARQAWLAECSKASNNTARQETHRCWEALSPLAEAYAYISGISSLHGP